MTPDTRTLALAIGLGVSLAACGGGDGNGAPDSTTATSKALPAGTPNTTASPAASSTQASSARTTKATESDPVIRKAPEKYNGVEYEIRGDALIQALLTSVIPRNGHNEVQMAWLDGSFGAPLPIYPLPAKPVPTSGSAQLVTEDIAPDTSGSLGSHVYTAGVTPGPLRGALHMYSTEKNSWLPYRETPRFTVRFGVSQAGISRDGTVPPVGALEFSKTVQWSGQEPLRADQNTPSPQTDLTLAATDVSGGREALPLQPKLGPLKLDPAGWYALDPSRATYGIIWWTDQEAGVGVRIEAKLNRSDPTRQFDTCILNAGTGFMLQRICHTWEIPDGWTSGQPLKHLNHALWEEYPRNTQGLPFWLWDDRDHLPTATQASLATTSTPVDARGVSGAVVAALFDAFTPRAQGMRNLTQRAGSAPTMREDTFVRKLHEHSWVSLIHESRASQYADGSTDTGSHSPAIGSYLYTFRSGGWESAANPRAVTPDAPLQTLTMHVANDPEKGFTLPRWLDVQLNEDDSNKAVTPHFAGELRAIDDKARTVQPNELVMYGTPLQTWITPAGGADDTTVLVQASIEQSTRKDRSVDLCWQTAISHSSGRKYCTTWDIPEGWQPGQLLKPSSYYHYAMRGYRFSNEQGFWDSLVAH